MKDKLKTGFVDRLKTAAAAKQLMLDQLRPKPTRIDPQHAQRADLRAAELDAVREERTAAKVAKRRAAADAEMEVQRARAEEAALHVKRGERKERKALSAAEAKAKRDAKYAARKVRK